MDTNRRSILKASGMAAVLGATGLAGCSGGLLGGGGGSNVASYQYDPATLVQTRNKFFGSMNYAQMYQSRQYLPQSTRESFESTQSSPVKPKQLDTATGVGGAKISMTGSQSATIFGSMAVLGSFKKSTVTQRMQSQGNAQQSGTYQGFTLYQSSQGAFGPGSSLPSGTTGSATLAVGEGTVIVGAAGARGSGSASVTGRQAAQKMIDASMGNAKLITGTSQYAAQLNNRFAGSTFMLGAQIDPQLIQMLLGMSGGAGGMRSQMINGLRAGGFGMNINGQTTSMTFVAIYKDAQTAKQTGVVALVNGFSQRAVQQNPALDSINANYDGNSVVVTLQGKTKAIFQQGSSMGGTGFSVDPDAIPDA